MSVTQKKEPFDIILGRFQPEETETQLKSIYWLTQLASRTAGLRAHRMS